jgi:hypothetical protein
LGRGAFINTNYYGLEQVDGIFGGLGVTAAVKVKQAYAIDNKIDDGLPQSGNIIAVYPFSGLMAWAPLGPFAGGYFLPATFTTATAGSSTTCFDNNSVNGSIQQYSMMQNGGNGTNCALSIKLQ